MDNNQNQQQSIPVAENITSSEPLAPMSQVHADDIPPMPSQMVPTPENQDFKPTQKRIPLKLPKLNLTTLFSPKLKKIIILAVILMVLLLVIGGLAPIILNYFKKSSAPTPTPTPTPTPEAVVSNPSPYASDEVVLSLEDRINRLEEEMKIVNFRDDALRLPVLDWDIKF